MSQKMYAAYGSNMNTSDMKKRCPNSRVVAIGSLRGWRLTFRGSRAGYANVEPERAGAVPVVIWAISDECEVALDEYEEYPELYEKEVVCIETQTGSVSAMLYRMAVPHRNRPTIPASDYMECLCKGYAEHGFNGDVIEAALQEAIREQKDERAKKNRLVSAAHDECKGRPRPSGQ